MATFDQLESSAAASRPIEIFAFAIGGTTYRYTSAEDELVVDAQTYAAEAISRGPIAQGPDDRTRILDIELPASNEFAALYVDIVPGQRATATIIRLQRDEAPEFNTKVMIYKGFVQSVRFPSHGQKAVVGVRSIEAASSRPIPRFTYQGLCNHVLYDSGCGIDQSLFKHTGAVTDVTGNVITVTGADGEANGYYAGGFVKPDGLDDFRLILKHEGKELTLLLPFPIDVDGVDVDIYAGCDHKIDGHCQSRFDNVIEFGGFGFIPLKNPFTTKLV